MNVPFYYGNSKEESRRIEKFVNRLREPDKSNVYRVIRRDCGKELARTLFWYTSMVMVVIGIITMIVGLLNIVPEIPFLTFIGVGIFVGFILFMVLMYVPSLLFRKARFNRFRKKVEDSACSTETWGDVIKYEIRLVTGGASMADTHRRQDRARRAGFTGGEELNPQFEVQRIIGKSGKLIEYTVYVNGVNRALTSWRFSARQDFRIGARVRVKYNPTKLKYANIAGRKKAEVYEEDFEENIESDIGNDMDFQE